MYGPMLGLVALAGRGRNSSFTGRSRATVLGSLHFCYEIFVYPFEWTSPFANEPEHFTNRHRLERTQLFNPYIYITNVNEERERNHLSLLSILLLHFILNTLSTHSSSGQSRITRRSCARQLQGYKGLNGGCSWSCSPPLRMEEFLLHQRPFFACRRRIGLPSLKDTFATAVGHTRAWLCHEDVNG
jgi:hypothetical protein